MNASALLGTGWERDCLEVLWQDAERAFCKLWRDGVQGERYAFVPGLSDADHPKLESINRLIHEYELKEYLDGAWALRPVELVHERERTMLVVEYTKGEPLQRRIGHPMQIGPFLRLAVALSVALGRLHRQGLVHKDIKPGNVIVSESNGQVWLTGFGIASRVPRERQSPEPPEVIAGTLAYMAPEQTGRMNRSMDSRSDLYSLGVTLYEMLTGHLPFTATDAMEWVHCHIARRPPLPGEWVRDVPHAVSAIVMKLLSKTMEERYQTAAGVESDLRRCACEWDAKQRIRYFSPGSGDISDRLIVPEKLYGRDREIGTLLAAFDRVVSGGRPELVLVSGHPGIGKSAVVNELHKTLVPPRGLFASSKFEQHKHDIPYAALGQALQGLVRPLLSKSDPELHKWRDALRAALEPNGQLLVEMVPELQYVMGEQTPVPELAPRDAQRRFQLLLSKFIGVFAQPEHPLAMFFDDLQWLDMATLDLLEELLTCSNLRHLLLIGAYRDNEVAAAHPLMRKLETVRQSAAVSDIVIRPLEYEDLVSLSQDSLHCDRRRAEPLARLIHEKTSGNPFFTIQFLSMLADEGLIVFDYSERRWSWSLDRVRAKSYTDNVVELLVERLNRLPVKAQQTLQLFACLGNSARVNTLRTICGVTIEELHDCLWDAVRTGIIFRSDAAYRFLHDRVQEAAYSLIPSDERAAAHLRIGKLLAAAADSARREEAIFDIVNQLNRASHLMTSVEECQWAAGLNLLAARHAKSSTAYVAALGYLRVASALLTEKAWHRAYDLAFDIEYLMAECELLTGELSVAETRLDRLAWRAEGRHDFCLVSRLRITLYSALNQQARSVDVFLEWLRRDGTIWPKHPTQAEVLREYGRIRAVMGGRQIEELVNLPVIADPDVIDTLDVLTEVLHPALLWDAHLSALVVCRLVILSLEHGNCDQSCYAYAWLAVFAGPHFASADDGFRFGQLACNLSEMRGPSRYQARTYLSVGALVIPWTKHPRLGRELVRRAFDVAYRMGDLNSAAISSDVLVTMCLVVGDSLSGAQAEAESSLRFIKSVRYAPLIDISGAKLGLIRTLRGSAPIYGHLDDAEFSELEALRRIVNSNVGNAEFFYWTRVLQGRFFAGDHVSAVIAAENARSVRETWPSSFGTAAGEFHLYSALALAASCDSAQPQQRSIHMEALRRHCDWLDTRAEHNPETFESSAALAGAEWARLEGRVLEAEDLYEAAIRSAQTHGFIHLEAVANELAGRFYIARGFEKVANAYLRDARYCYLRWGADAKARQLEQLYRSLGAETRSPDVATTTLAPVEHLDLATVARVSEAVSGEIVLEKLIGTLTRTAVEHAGASRGLLILPDNDQYLIESEVTASQDVPRAVARPARVTAEALPESVFRHCLRARESVLLHDAAGDAVFADDHYIREHRTRSVLCLPIVKQTKLLAILYLENRLTPNAFTPAKMAILKVFASGAAISLENAQLYRDLAEREARIRRLVEANIVGIFIWDLEGRILDANDAFLEIVGRSREDLASRRLSWRDLTPPEWLERDERTLLPLLRSTGSLQPFEKEFWRQDGTRVPVWIGIATFEKRGHEGVAFVLDLTERKRTTDELRELQMELVCANRIATLGQLSASIGHEVNQPIGAAHNNACAALRFLATDRPDMEEVTKALACVVRDTYRAGDILGRIREQLRKIPPRTEEVDVNAAIEEVIELARSELAKNRIALRVQLGEGLPQTRGVRVELQQVALNLILNAIEAMSTEEEVRELSISSASSPDAGVLVSVRDSGPGVTQQDYERIFEPFFTTKDDGVGIGLAICRAIIDGHGGRLWAEAHAPRGTVFRFTLPAHH